MTPTPKQEVPDGLNEEYYQINADILGSFNKYRPPLNIFRLKEDVVRVLPFYKVGERLSNEQVEELSELVGQGLVFVSREDHPVYVKHISYQLDLVLSDKNLKEGEIADIFKQALTRRLKEFLDQPVSVVFDRFWIDLMVLTEYLFQDIHRIRALFKRLHMEHSLENHSFNSGVAGIALFAQMNKNNFEEGGIARKTFDRLVSGLFMHDMGMTKIPAFIRDKTKPLTPDERTKVLQHVKAGYEMLGKLNLRYPEVEACVMEHHERLGGQGYPQKKKGDDISTIGRLCGLVDSYCAMVTKRPYAEAIKPMAAVAELSKGDNYDSEMAVAMQVMLLDYKIK